MFLSRSGVEHLIVYISSALSITKSQVLRNLVVAQLAAGKTVPEILPVFKTEASKATLYRIASDCAAGVVERPKKAQHRRPKKMTHEMAANMIRLLTKAKRHYSIRSIARLLNLSHVALRCHLKKRGINTVYLQEGEAVTHPRTPAGSEEKMLSSIPPGLPDIGPPEPTFRGRVLHHGAETL